MERDGGFPDQSPEWQEGPSPATRRGELFQVQGGAVKTRRKNSFGGGLTATDMKTCTWLKPELVCQVRFSGWTDDDSIRHPVFLGFRDDKDPRKVKREKPIPS